MIDKYGFGKIVIDGKLYRNDLIIYQDKVDDKWWRKEGHTLQPEDITDIIAQKPDTLVVGIGTDKRMKIKPETLQLLQENNIALIAEDTMTACLTYNHLKYRERVVAALHLTC